MIELLDPRKITCTNQDLWLNAGWSYSLDYSWIIAHALFHFADKTIPYGHQPIILDVGCGVEPYSPLGGRLASVLHGHCIGIDRAFGQNFMDLIPVQFPNLIVWASSLEHNTPEDMKACYLRSMEMLAPGGLFLATITISETSHWFEPSKNTCLSPADAIKLFDEPKMGGDYEDSWETMNIRGTFAEVRQAYREDEFMMDKYLARYGHFDETDPDFIIAGVAKVKS